MHYCKNSYPIEFFHIPIIFYLDQKIVVFSISHRKYRKGLFLWRKECCLPPKTIRGYQALNFKDDYFKNGF